LGVGAQRSNLTDRVRRMAQDREFFREETRTKLLDFCMEVERLGNPADVLNSLHDIVRETLLNVLGANRFSVKVGDWRRVEIGKTAFIHKSVPQSWVDEWTAFVANGHPIGIMTARMCLAPFTWTELSRMLDPVGADRWPFELALKYGMRDGYLCPVGGRWVVGFWSPKLLGDAFTQQARGLIYMAVSAAAVRLERLAGYDVKRVGRHASLTPREQSVLRHASTGQTSRETANVLGLSEETVRSHFKKAQAKLGARNRTHAVAEALRDLLII